MSHFTTNDIALAIEIPGVYDGISAYLLRDGTLVNRWAGTGINSRYIATRDWIHLHGTAFREANRDLLNTETP